MQFQTLDTLVNRCEAELPGFDKSRHESLIRTWVWEALKIIDSHRLGYPKTETLRVGKGMTPMPADYLGFIRASAPAFVHIVPAIGAIQSTKEATVTLEYTALYTDEDGYPLVPDVAETGVFAWINYRFTELWQKNRWMASANIRIDKGLDRANKIEAEMALTEARGAINQFSRQEVEELAYYRQRTMTYRND